MGLKVGPQPPVRGPDGGNGAGQEQNARWELGDFRNNATGASEAVKVPFLPQLWLHSWGLAPLGQAR